MMDFSEDRRSSAEDKDMDPSKRARARHSTVPWATLVRALGRFKLSIPDIRRYYNLSSRDPLALEKDRRPRDKHHKATVKKFWGNQQPLSKVRTTHQCPRTQVPSGHPSEAGRPLCTLPPQSL